MKIRLCLGWQKPGSSLKQAFKSDAARKLFEDYLKKISRYSQVISCAGIPSREKTGSGSVIWLCSLDAGAKPVSSEFLADRLEALQVQGCRELWIGIGNADGFDKKIITKIKPDFIWKFGPMTLPHELAAVIATEQIYRGFTILQGHPYHTGH